MAGMTMLARRCRTQIEVKRLSAPDIPKGFRMALDVLKPPQSFVVHGGEGSWEAGGGIAAMSLVELMKKLAQ